MSVAHEEFSRIADAERQLCEEAGPVIRDVIRAIMARTGLRITEVRVTLDLEQLTDHAHGANCTIIDVDTNPTFNGGQNPTKAREQTGRGRPALNAE
ncbi:MAG: hypothetical protein ABI537_01930 [Casimicrobiaceae bacterium]